MTAVEAGDLVKHTSPRVAGVFKVVEVREADDVLCYGGQTPAWRTFRLADLNADRVRDRERLAFTRLLERQAELAERIPRSRGRLRT